MMMTSMAQRMTSSGAPTFLRSILAVTILLALNFLGGCVRSFEPVLKTDQLVTDEMVVGKWTAKSGKETVEIGSADEAKQFKVVFTDSEGKRGEFWGRLGEVKNLKIFEYRPIDPADSVGEFNKVMLIPTYSFLIIRQTAPDIIFTGMSLDWLKKYVAAHPDELRVVRRGDDMIITASTDELQAFLLRHAEDAGAFGEPQTYVYVDPAKKNKR